MAEFYECKTENKNITLGCYSERGIMAYYFLHFLPKNDNVTNCFIKNLRQHNNLLPDDLTNIAKTIIFSELDLGNRGFGKPDGAVYFETENNKYFIFIEAKFNETYKDSCGDLRFGDTNYNSTLKGQLELKYKFVQSLFNVGVQEIKKDNCIVYDGQKLKVKEGVEKIVNILEKCNESNVYYLGITDEDNYPFNENSPDIHPKENILWLPKKAITDDLPKE